MIDYAYNQFATERFRLPDEEQVLALEQRIGVQLPTDFRDYVLRFNGGYFCEPEIQTDDEEAAGDALTCMFGIDSGDKLSELAEPGCLGIFEDNDPPIFIPIGYTSLGGFIVMITEEENRGMILLKKANGGFHFLAEGIEEFFALLRGRQK
jgi:hypothetical protein